MVSSFFFFSQPILLGPGARFTSHLHLIIIPPLTSWNLPSLPPYLLYVACAAILFFTYSPRACYLASQKPSFPKSLIFCLFSGEIFIYSQLFAFPEITPCAPSRPHQSPSFSRLFFSVPPQYSSVLIGIVFWYGICLVRCFSLFL